MEDARDRIANYYRLCTVSRGGKNHALDTVNPADLSAIFSEKEQSAYLMEAAGRRIARETIVGGDDDTVVTHHRRPIIAIM